MKKKLPILSFVVAIITMLIGILVIIGWFTHNDFLRALVPGQVKMKFNVALGFVFSSIALLFYYFPGKNKIPNSASFLLSVIVSLIGLLTLAEYIFGFNIGIDEIFIKDELRTTAIYYAGRMSPLAALNFLLIGTGLLLLNKEKTAIYQFYYLSGIAFVALLMLIGFNFISDIPTYIRLAIHVAIGFITLPIAIWFAQPMLQKKISFERKLFTGFAAVIILMAILGIFSSYYSDKRISTSHLVEHSNNVLSEAEQTLSLAKDIESGGRDYIMTGDSTYLEYFTIAKNTIFNHVKKLKELTKESPAQQVRIDSLSVLVNKRIAFLLLRIQLRNEKGSEAANKLMATRLGKFYTDKIRNVISAMQQEENNLQALDQRENDKSVVSFNRAFFVFLAGVLILLVIILFSIHNNIIVRKKAEEQSRESEEQIRTIFNAAPDAVTVIDEQGIIIKWNTKAETLFGWKAAEVMGRLLSETIIPLRYREAHQKGMKHFLETGKGPVLDKTIDIQAINKNNVEIDVALSISPTIVNDKHLFIGFVRDITERIKAEEILKKAKKDFQLLVSSVKDYAIFLLDINGRVASWNSGAENIKGYTAEEIIGQPIDVFYTAEEKQRGVPQSNLQVALQQGHLEAEGWRVRKDGSTFYANVVFTALIDDEGSLYGYAKVTKDITEKRKTEERLRFLATIADNIQDPVISTDNATGNNFIITRWNKPAEKLLEWKSEEVMGKNAMEIFKTDYPYETREQIFELLKAKGFWQGEIIYHTKSGRPVYVLSTISYLKDAEGNITGNLVLIRDITKRKNAEEALSKLNEELEQRVKERTEKLAASEMHFRSLIENSAEGIALTDEFSNNIYRSPAATKIMGDLPKENTVSFSHPDDLENIKNIRIEVLKHPGLPVAFQGRFLHASGHYVWLEGTLTNLLHVEGVSAIVTNFREITQRKEAEEKIIKSEKIYKTIASSIPGSVICLLDAEYRYLLIEGDMLEKLGYSKDKLLGNKAADVLPPEIFAGAVKDLEKVLKGETITGESSRLGYDIISRFIPLKDENNVVYAIMTVAIDVTKLKNAQRDIAELNRDLEEKIISRTEQLRKSNEELEAFSYSVSHDLRAPLRAIIGFTAILEEDYGSKLDEEAMRITSVIKNNTLKMGNLIDDLLAFSRTGKQELIKTRIDTTAMVQEIIDDLVQHNKTNHSISWNVHTLPAVNADINTLRQVWINLISNSIKYSGTKAQSHIEIGSYPKNGQQVFYIKDNGVGFDEQYKNKLFKVFQRLHSSEEFEGTGVGLALVEKIIFRHGGKVWADGKVNEGASFYFSLPV